MHRLANMNNSPRPKSTFFFILIVCGVDFVCETCRQRRLFHAPYFLWYIAQLVGEERKMLKATIVIQVLAQCIVSHQWRFATTEKMRGNNPFD